MNPTTIGAIAAVDTPGRTVDVLCVPYDETSYLTPNPAGERVEHGAFASACRHPGKVFLFRSHDHTNPIGRAVRLWEEHDGLHGTFAIRETPAGDQVLADLADGYLPAASIGFRPTRAVRGPRGETVVIEGQLKEVSLLTIGAYDGAKVLALRAATHATQPTSHLLVLDRHQHTPAVDAGPAMDWHVPASLRYLVDRGVIDNRRP